MCEESAAFHNDCGSPYDLNHIYVLGNHLLHRCGLNICNVLVHWRCPEGHRWQATGASRIATDDAGCPTCWSQVAVVTS